MARSTTSPDAPHADARRRVARATLCLALLAATLMAPAAAATRSAFRGAVTHVSDGDTVWVRPARGGAPIAVRLQGLDAPEICQAHGLAARDALIARTLHAQVTVRGRSHDMYQRLLARIGTDSEPDLGAWLVEQGHAWAASRGARARYGALELQARALRRGLWAQPGAIEPRQFRQRHGSCGAPRGAGASGPARHAR